MYTRRRYSSLKMLKVFARGPAGAAECSSERFDVTACAQWPDQRSEDVLSVSIKRVLRIMQAIFAGRSQR
jgi:hypothetical protein